MSERKYTAEEMRTRAKYEDIAEHPVVADMLRQAADMMDRLNEVYNGKFDGEIQEVWGVGDVYTTDTILKMQNYIRNG